MPYLQAVVKYSGQGSQLRNMFYVEVPTNGYANGQAVANYIGNAYSGLALEVMSNGVSLNAIGIRPLNQGSFPEVDLIPDGWPMFGTVGDQQLPQQVAALVRFSTPQVRPNRKWTFIAGLTEQQWGGGAWTANTIISLMGWGLEMVEMPTETNGQFRIVPGRYVGNDVYEFGAGGIQNHFVEPYARIQRRRRPGVGI